jgi:hypothetical protein
MGDRAGGNYIHEMNEVAGTHAAPAPGKRGRGSRIGGMDVIEGWLK